MRIATFVVLLASVACRAAPEEPASIAGAAPAPGHAPAPADAIASAPHIYRVDHDVASLVVIGETLVWTDVEGALYTMPVRGGDRHQLSTQYREGRPQVVALAVRGEQAIGTRDKDLLQIDLPAGPLAAIPIDLGDDSATTLESDGASIFFNVLDGDEVWQIAPDGKKIMRAHARKAALAIAGDALYAASWQYGTVLAIPIAGGSPRTLAKGLPHPTGFAADGVAVYVWCEDDHALRRIDVKTGEQKLLVRKGLYGADELRADGDWIYGRAMVGKGRSKLFRVTKDGSRLEVFADGLQATALFISRDAIYVGNFAHREILRFDTATLVPSCVGPSCIEPEDPH